MAFGTAPRRIGSEWYTRSGRKLSAKGQHYWDIQYRLGNVTLDGHWNAEHAAQTKLAQHAPTRAGRVAAGKRVGQMDKAQQDKLQAQGKAGLSLATLGASDVIGAVGKDTVRSIQKKKPTLSASKKLGKDWVVDPVTTAVHHPSAKNIALGVGGAMAVLPVGRIPKEIGLAAKAARGAKDVERAAKIKQAGLEGHHALVAGDAVAQLGPVQGLARPVAHIAAKVSYSRPHARIIGAHARVAKALGRNLVHDQLRVKAAKALHIRRVAKLHGHDNVAHYWWAQVGPKLRNVEGLRQIKNRLHQEWNYVTSGNALADLQDELMATTEELKNVQFGTEDYYHLVGQKVSAQKRIEDLPNAARNLQAAVGKLEGTIRKNPKYNPEVINSIKVLEKDRRDIGIAAGKLDPERAANRSGLVMNWLGHEPTGEEVYIGHRLGNEPPPPEGLVPRSPGTGRAKLPRGWSHKNESILLNHGRVDQDVHTAVRDWEAAHAYRGIVRSRHEVGQMGTDYHGEQIDWQTHALMNPEGKVIPSGWKVDELAQLKKQGFDEEQVRKLADESLKEWLIDNPKAYGQMVLENGGDPIAGLRLVRRDDLLRYFKQMGAGTSNKVEQVYDQALSAVMMQLIFARAGYIPKNLLQNAVMIVPHQGLMVAVNMPRAAQLAPVLRGVGKGVGAVRHQTEEDRIVWDLLQNAHGSGGATAGATAGLKETGVVGRVTHTTSGAVTSVADAVPRTSAVIHELARKGVISKFNPHLTDQEKLDIIAFFEGKHPKYTMADVRDVEHASKDAMGDFNRLAPGQRRWLRRFFIVPNWLVAGTRWPAHFALNHPIKAGAIVGAGYYGFGGPGMPTHGNPPLRMAKGVPPWAIGIETPFGVERLGSIIPASIPGDILLAASQGDFIGVSQYANPMLTAIAMSFAGYQTYPTFAKKVGVSKATWNNMLRLIPNYKLFMDLRNGSGSTTYPGDKSIIGRLRRESGVLPIPIARQGGGYGEADTGSGDPAGDIGGDIGGPGVGLDLNF